MDSCKNNQVVFQPLDSYEFITELSLFCDLLFTSIGAEGRLKILVTSGGYSIVTSSSERILKNFPLCNPICQFISQVMKSQLSEFMDFGLFTGVLASSLLAKSLTQTNLSTYAASSLVQHLSSQFYSHLESIKMKVDFSTVKQFFPFVKSIILSKPACKLSMSDSNELAIIIVKSFLNSVNKDLVGDVVVICGESTDLKNAIYSGVLYQTIQEYDHSMLQEMNRMAEIPIIIFNIMLCREKPAECSTVDRAAKDTEVAIEYDLNKTLKVMKYVVEIGVKIVACQKVVHPVLSLFLRRNKVLLLDRLGTELTHNLENLSGAVPISDVEKCSVKEGLVPLLGHISSARQIKHGKKSYLSLERTDRSVTTLVVCGTVEEASEEIKIITKQAFRSLRHLLCEPYLLPGAGCTEMSLIASLEALTHSVNGVCRVPASQLYACLCLLQKSLLKAAGFSNLSLATLSVDTVYYHAWTRGKENSSCKCGLVNSAMVHKEGKGWQNLNLNAGKLLSECGTPKHVLLPSLDDDVILDLFASKRNALKLALECYAALMEIGIVVC